MNAHLATGSPILTHTNFGEHALEQANYFDKLGADLNHVVLSHVDRNKDIEYIKAVLDTGVKVEFDSAFRWDKKDQDNHTLKLLEILLPIYPDQITLGMDMARNTYWKSYGGSPGLNYLLETIPGFLKVRNMEEFYLKLFFDNPKQLFSFIN